MRFAVQNCAEPPHERMTGLVLNTYTTGKTSGLLWDNPEQFLERVELAVANPHTPTAKHIHSYLGVVRAQLVAERPELNDPARMLALLHTEAVRFVAAACTAFLQPAEEDPKVVTDYELWEPYLAWTNHLHPSDSVITFNYDRVPDLLERSGRVCFASPFHRDFATRLQRRAAGERVIEIFHMHGSVNLQYDPENPLGRIEYCDRPVAHTMPERAVLGVPGIRKKQLATGPLKEVWAPATERLAQADVVVFVGYRFPETDSMSKRIIISALKDNPRAHLHMVLGQDLNNDARRVQRMLQWAQRPAGGRIVNHYMTAQDFFTVFGRNELLNSAPWD